MPELLSCECIGGLPPYDRLTAIYQAAVELSGDTELPEEECIAGLPPFDRFAYIYAAFRVLAADDELPSFECVRGLPYQDQVTLIYQAARIFAGDETLPEAICIYGTPIWDQWRSIYAALYAASTDQDALTPPLCLEGPFAGLSESFCALASGEAGPVDADWALFFEDGTINNLLTVANLNAAMVGGTTETWSLTSVPIDHTFVVGENSEPLRTLAIGGTTYDGAGTRSINFDLDLRESGGLGVDAFQTTIPAGHGNLSISSIITPSMDRDPAGLADGRVDIFQIADGADFAVAQHQILFSESVNSGGAVYAHGSVGGVSTFSLRNIALVKGEKIHLTLRLNAIEGKVQVCVLRYSDGTLLGAVEANADAAEPKILTVADYLTTFGGFLTHDSFACGYDENAAFPMAANVNVQTPTVTPVQTGDTEVTVTITDCPALRFKIDRRTNGGSWVELEDAQNALTYVDSTVSAPNVYEYRAKGSVGVNESAFGTSDPITVVTLVWTDSLPGASTDTTDNNFGEFPSLQPIVAGTTGSCTRARIWIRNYNNPVTLKMQLYSALNVLIAQGSVTNALSSSGSFLEVIFDSPVPVVATVTYGIGFCFSDNTDGQPGYLTAQPANTSYKNFGSSFAATPLNPYITAGNGLTWKFSAGMGVIPA